MTRYYDIPTRACEDCALRQRGAFPDGWAYWACRGYGYILHYDKGIVDEPCDRYVKAGTPTAATAGRPRPLSLREMMKQSKT